MVVIIDYGMGNLRSILHKLEKLKFEATISDEPAVIDRATHLILPGVGHFATGMKNLTAAGLLDVLNKKVLEDKTPIMGLCLGMQLFTRHSEEGDAKGLGWIDGETRHFEFGDADTDGRGRNARLRIPHVGWNLLNVKRACPMLADVQPDQRFYFVHSYYVTCDRDEDIVATTHYGCDFVSVLRRDNIFGTQCHPEKSHRRGIEVIRRFVEEA